MLYGNNVPFCFECFSSLGCVICFHSCWYSSVMVFKNYLGLNVLLSAFGLLQSAFQILIVHSSGLKKGLFSKG